LLVALIANWALSHNNPEIKSQSASAEMTIKAGRRLGNELGTSPLPTGSAAPSSAQTDDGSVVTIFRGGRPPTIVPSSPGAAESDIGSVIIIAGSRIIVVTPQQTAGLPSAAPAIGAGAGMSAGLIALPTR
jgi:hypothetical protein